MKPQQMTANSVVQRLGDDLIICLSGPLAELAGFHSGLPVQITAVPGQLVIELTSKKLSLEEMLAKFDPQKHGGEAMSFAWAGKECLSFPGKTLK